jgi:hypothetical protein
MQRRRRNGVLRRRRMRNRCQATEPGPRALHRTGAGSTGVAIVPGDDAGSMKIDGGRIRTLRSRDGGCSSAGNSSGVFDHAI